MLLNKTLTISNDGLKRMNREVEARNEILINSHSMFEEKWTKIVNAFDFYKDFHRKYSPLMQDIRSSKSPNRSVLQHSDVSCEIVMWSL